MKLGIVLKIFTVSCEMLVLDRICILWCKSSESTENKTEDYQLLPCSGGKVYPWANQPLYTEEESGAYYSDVSTSSKLQS